MMRTLLATLIVLLTSPAVLFSQEPRSTSSSTDAVLLGGKELSQGIPGNGPLTTVQIKSWLANPRNHETLAVKLPQGLAAGESAIHIPEDNPLTRAKIELGRQLFFDNRLSGDGTISCASCHHPDTGYGRDTQFGVGIGDQTGNRNSPVSFNRIVSQAQFWDGRADSLEEQAKGPIANPIEMGYTHDACVATLGAIDGYQLQFATIFPKEGLTIDTVAKAIASFERILVTGTSPADYYEPLRVLEEQYADDLTDLETFKEDEPEIHELYVSLKKASDAHPMNESARRGRALFFSQRTNCTTCHVGANFADEKYHNLGVGMGQKEPDLGRFAVTNREEDRGAFKTPTIRNVVHTGPYMHDGSLKTLEEVVEYYDQGGVANPSLSKHIKKLNLTAQEKSDLVEYMKSLTGPFPSVESERLPE